MTSMIFVACAVFGFLLGAVIVAVLGFVIMGRDMFTLSERFNSLYSQNSTILSNLSNPAVSGLMNTLAQDENKKGFDSGLNFAFLSLYRMYSKEGMIVGDFDQVSEQLKESIGTLLAKQDVRDKTHEKLIEYYKSKESDNSDDD